VKSAIVYNLRDKGTNRDDTEDNFGLMTRDYAPKPAYAAVRAAWHGEVAAPKEIVPAKAPVLHVRIVVSNGTVFAKGKAPARALVRLRVSSCRSKCTRHHRVRAARSGHFRRRLGSVRRVRGARVVVRVPGRRAMAARVGRRR